MIVGLLFVTFIAAVANGFAVSNFLSSTPDYATMNQTLNGIVEGILTTFKGGGEHF